MKIKFENITSDQNQNTMNQKINFTMEYNEPTISLKESKPIISSELNNNESIIHNLDFNQTQIRTEQNIIIQWPLSKIELIKSLILSKLALYSDTSMIYVDEVMQHF